MKTTVARLRRPPPRATPPSASATPQPATRSAKTSIFSRGRFRADEGTSSPGKAKVNPVIQNGLLLRMAPD
ncbi:MAG TPA: hypothetical protein VF223_05370, partial [Trebonia sp.]